MKYRYYIVFLTKEEKTMGVGSCELVRNFKIKTMSDILGIANDLKEFNHVSNVTVLNYQRIK